MVARVSVLVVVSDLDAFRRLLASLDRQTLPSSEFDVVVADRGPRAEVALLRRLADHRPNVRVIEGGATPWAALVGASAAEAVVPLYDTDTLYEGALARLVEEARSADVVLGKSVCPGARAPSWNLMTADRVVDPSDVDPRSVEGLAVAMTRELAEQAAQDATQAADLRRGAATGARTLRAVATQLCLRSAPTTAPLERGANPAVVQARFVGDELVITGVLGARCSLRSLETDVEWPLQPDAEDQARLRIDVRSAALGGRLEPGRWLVETADGIEPPVGLLLKGESPGSRLVGEQLVVAKVRDGRRLILDVGATHKNPFRPVAAAAASIVEAADGTRLLLPLGITFNGDPAVLPATLYVGELPLRARLAAADGQVALECLLSGVPGKSALQLAVAGSAAYPLGLELVISNRGDMTLSQVRTKKRARAEPPPQTRPRSRTLGVLAAKISGRPRST